MLSTYNRYTQKGHNSNAKIKRDSHSCTHFFESLDFIVAFARDYNTVKEFGGGKKEYGV